MEPIPLPMEIRSGHPYLMYEEIHVQPEAIARAVDVAGEAAITIAGALQNARRIVIVGNGTSLHGSQAGAWLLQRALPETSVVARQALDFMAYDAPVPGDVVLLVSHSGATHMTLRALERARAGSAFSIAVTGFPGADLGRAADALLPTGYEAERSYAHTVSYTAALTAFAALAVAAGGDGMADVRESLPRLPALARETLRLEETARRLARDLVGARSFWFAGGGPNAITAAEAALKMTETNYSLAVGRPLEEMLHGYLAGMDERDVLWLIAPPGNPARERAAGLLRAVAIIGSTCVVQDSADEAPLPTPATLTVPSVPEVLSPILQVIPLQLFSYFVAVEHGINPDPIRWQEDRYYRARRAYR